MEKRTSILCNLVVALAVLLVAGAAHAQVEVILDSNGYVAEIKNLPVILQSEESVLLDVQFVVGDAFDAYGPELEFDFGTSEAENAVLSIIASFRALNEESPIPTRAGPDGSDQFFAGTNLLQEGVIESYGAEYFVIPTDPFTLAETWGACDSRATASSPDQRECLIGVLVIPPTDVLTWAIFTLAGTVDAPEISLMPEALTPAVLFGENATGQQVSVANSGGGTLDYTITDDQTWLSLSSSSGMVVPGPPDVVTVSYDSSALDLGVHQATITVSDANASNDPQTVEVTLLVTELPAISLSKTMLMPQAALGDGALPDSFTVTNSGGLVLVYDVSEDATWMSVNPTSGVSTGEAGSIDVVYDTTGLAENVYNGTITVTDLNAANSEQTIDVALTISGSVELGLTSARQTSKVNNIPGLEFDAESPYMKCCFPLDMPQTGISGNTLFHAGGAFTFSSNVTMESFRYGNWTFEIRTTCAADNDPCLVTTDNGTPWALRDVDLDARTARMVFTDTGAQAFNDLNGDDIFVVEETFADVTFIPEPSAAALSGAALAALGFIRLASRRRRH